MVTVRDIPGNLYVERLAEYLFKNYRNVIKPPVWANFVKTGPDRERNPDFYAEVNFDGGPGWWYYRAASILRQVYLKGPIGVSRLRKKYGGLRKRGMEPGRFVKGYGKIVRLILQQLEQAGLVMQVKEGKKKGRVVTNQGKSIMDKLAKEIYEELPEENKNLENYLKSVS
ncbi:MAG: 30S ribosomal protein S19e [Nanopusillaceae archaeon]